MNLKDLGKFIAKMRKSRNLTQEKLADFLHVHPKTVSKWERGITAPDIGLLIPLCETLGVTSTELLNCKLKDNSSGGTVEAIKYYTEKSKTKYFKIFLVILFVVMFMFSIIICVIKYNEFYLYKIDTANSDYNIQGYIGYNQNKSMIFINSIDYIDEYVGTDKETRVKDVSVKLFCGEEILHSSSYAELIEGESENINSIFQQIRISIDEGNIKCHDFDDLSLSISYITKDDKEINSSIQLNLIKSS